MFNLGMHDISVLADKCSFLMLSLSVHLADIKAETLQMRTVQHDGFELL